MGAGAVMDGLNKPAPKGHIIEVDAMYVGNHMGHHQFVFNAGDSKPMAGHISFAIPAGEDPGAFEYGDNVRFTLEKLNAPKRPKARARAR
jgi:hypothetical protein